MTKTKLADNSECVLWQGGAGCGANGEYGKFSWTHAGRQYFIAAHVFAARVFLLGGGPITGTNVVHHFCRQKLCVLGAHMTVLPAEAHRELHRGDYVLAHAVEAAMKDSFPAAEAFEPAPYLPWHRRANPSG
jgi:hypothetical protein